MIPPTLYLQEKFDPAFPQLTSWRLAENMPNGATKIFWEISYKEIASNHVYSSSFVRGFRKEFGTKPEQIISFTYQTTPFSSSTDVKHANRTKNCEEMRRALKYMVLRLNESRQEAAKEAEAQKTLVWQDL